MRLARRVRPGQTELPAPLVLRAPRERRVIRDPPESPARQVRKVRLE